MAGMRYGQTDSHMRFIDRLSLVLVCLGLSGICVLYLKTSSEMVANMDNALYGQGRVMLWLVAVSAVYVLQVRPIWKQQTSALVRCVVLWAAWTCMSSFALLDTMKWTEWIAVPVMSSLCWPCVFLFFVQFGRVSGPSQLPARFFSCMAVFSAAGVFYVRNAAMNAAGWQTNVFNAVYYPVITIPWVMLLDRDIFRSMTLVLASVSVLFSAKRTALVAVVGAGMAFLGSKAATGSRLSYPSTVVVIALLGLGVATWEMAGEVIGAQAANYVERIANIPEDNGSGRIDVYREYADAFSHMETSELIIGHGFNSGTLALSLSAHNDWLEALYDFGVIGLGLYCSLHVLLLRTILRLVRTNSPFAAPSAVAYSIFLSMSLLSHLIIYPTYFLVLAAYWGMVEGRLLAGQASLHTGRTVRVCRSLNQRCAWPAC